MFIEARGVGGSQREGYWSVEMDEWADRVAHSRRRLGGQPGVEARGIMTWHDRTER